MCSILESIKRRLHYDCDSLHNITAVEKILGETLIILRRILIIIWLWLKLFRKTKNITGEIVNLQDQSLHFKYNNNTDYYLTQS